MGDDEKFTKVLVDLPNGNGIGGESMWAVELGDDLFELRNVPFHSYGLNFGDVVRAIPDRPDEKPRVLEVVRPSGHQTLRVVFLDDLTNDAQRLEHLRSLARFGATYEGRSRSLFAVDIEPDGDVNAVRDVLDVLLADGILGYETTEPRVAGSFDDLPDE